MAHIDLFDPEWHYLIFTEYLLLKPKKIYQKDSRFVIGMLKVQIPHCSINEFTECIALTKK